MLSAGIMLGANDAQAQVIGSSFSPDGRVVAEARNFGPPISFEIYSVNARVMELANRINRGDIRVLPRDQITVQGMRVDLFDRGETRRGVPGMEGMQDLLLQLDEERQRLLTLVISELARPLEGETRLDQARHRVRRLEALSQLGGLSGSERGQLGIQLRVAQAILEAEFNRPQTAERVNVPVPPSPVVQQARIQYQRVPSTITTRDGRVIRVDVLAPNVRNTGR